MQKLSLTFAALDDNQGVRWQRRASVSCGMTGVTEVIRDSWLPAHLSIARRAKLWAQSAELSDQQRMQGLC